MSATTASINSPANARWPWRIFAGGSSKHFREHAADLRAWADHPEHE